MMIVDEEEKMQVATKVDKMVLIEQVGVLERSWNDVERGEEMYLAKGLGIDGGSNYSGEFYRTGGDGVDMQGTEEYFKKMVQENPLFLRNYAQFLYQTERDLQGAEEYYMRAILANPKDGDILSQYAKLGWELHRVMLIKLQSTLKCQFKCLLKIKEDEDECVVPRDFYATRSHFREGAMASLSA